MSNKINDEIIEGLTAEIHELGGDIHALFEKHDFNNMSDSQIIEILEGYVDDLHEAIEAEQDDRKLYEKTRGV